MNVQDLDFGAISQLLGSLSESDVENLKNAASTMFSSQQNQAPPPKKEEPQPNGFDFSSAAKLASIMSLLSSEQHDPRTDLLNALRPMLGSDRQQKIDQAVKMLKLFSIIPKLKEIS